MSAVTVIYNRDNKPVNHKIFRTIFSKLDYRGLDGRNIVHNGSVTIGHQHFWTTPEEVDEIQPLIDTENKITLAFDGRIDNRDELLKLEGYKNKDSKISDARLLLDLYIRFQSNLFEKLIGPFLIIIHDQIRKELLLVRDPVGDRTIFYYYDEKVFIASSEEHSILEHPSVSKELNEKSIVKLLTLSLPDYDQTFFKDIKELPPAYFIKFKDNELEISRYWNFTKSNDRKYSGSLDDLAEEYYSLLNDSVKSCLRSVYKPAVMMSGGIDSTTVAYLAVNNLNSNGFELPLTTISGVFNELENCNESKFINDLEEKIDINAVKIPCDDAYPLSDEKKFFRNPNTPFDDPFRILSERVYTEAFNNGNKVVLTGHHGDDLYFKGYYDHLLELIRHGKILEFIINLIILYNKEGFKQLFKHPSLRRLFGFYRAIFEKKSKIPEHIKFKDNALKFLDETLSDNKNDYSYINRNSTKLSTYEYGYAGRMNMDIRLPYRNRKLIEFINNLPAYYLYNRGIGKIILKKALVDRLPLSILKRDDNISLSDLFDKGLPRITEILRQNNVEKPQLWNKYLHKHTFSESNKTSVNDNLSYNFLMWCSVSLELWKKRYNYL